MKFINISVLFLSAPCLPYLMPDESTFAMSRYFYIAWIINCIILFLVFIFILSRLIFFSFKSSPDERSLQAKTNISNIAILLLLNAILFFNGPKIMEYWQIQKFNNVVETMALFEKENNRWPINHKEINFDNRYEAAFYAIKSYKVKLDDKECPAKFKYNGSVLFGDLDCDIICCKEKPKGPPYEFLCKGKYGYRWYKFCYY